MTVKSFVKEWVEVIRPLFPTKSIIKFKVEKYIGVIVDTNEVEPYEGGDVIFEIHWKLGNDKKRLNKRSRLIQIRIEEVAIDDCVDSNEAGLKLKEIIEVKLSTFDPDVDSPIEEWEISTSDLN